MAQRLKTVAYAFPAITSTVTNNTLTNFTQITVYLPESSKTIHRAWVEFSADDIVTASGNWTTKTLELRLGSASYTSNANGNTLTSSGENVSLFLTRDFTSHFTSNWSGTSMTCDLRFQINQSSGTTLGITNVCATLYVTYEYDDTSTTQVKTVYIPMSERNTSLATTKTAMGDIPNLDTYLPEASKTYRDIHVVMQANTCLNNTTDHTVSFEIDSLGATASGNYEGALQTDRWTRFVWGGLNGTFTTNATHTLNIWTSAGSVARHHTPHVYMVVTYEFNASSTTSVMNSLLLPMEIDTPIGTSSTDFQRASRELWVQEPSPTLRRLAFLCNWNNAGNESGLNARIGTGSFVALTNTGAGVIAGSKGFMLRNDSPTGISFGRGRNTLSVDLYATLANQGSNFGGLWIVNYTSDIATGGLGTHNNTVIYPLAFHDTGNVVKGQTTSAVSPPIPETNYFVTALGLRLGIFGSSTGYYSAPAINAERLVAEGGLAWESCYGDAGVDDSEIGLSTTWAQIRHLFTRWNGDVGSGRLPLKTNRRYMYFVAVGTGTTGCFWENVHMYITYHSITYTISGEITNSAGGTVSIAVHRTATGERILTGSRVGNGSYSFTWYDDTEEVYVVARESGTLLGRSDNGYAS